MWPLLLIGGGLFAVYLLSPRSIAMPAGPGNAGAISAAKADALLMLNFPAFSLTAPPRETSIAYLAPAGQTRASAKLNVESVSGPVDDIELIRGGIPIPPPLGGGPPAYADLWLTSCRLCGPTDGPAQVITPDFALQQILNARALAALPGVDAPRQLAGLLYAQALRPAGWTERDTLFIPVAGSQAP